MDEITQAARAWAFNKYPFSAEMHLAARTGYAAGYTAGLERAAKKAESICPTCDGDGAQHGPMECCGNWQPAGGREDGEPVCCGMPISQPYQCQHCGPFTDAIRTLAHPPKEGP